MPPRITEDSQEDSQIDSARRGDSMSTPVLIGTNVDEGRTFVHHGLTPEQFEARIRAGCGPYADAILAAYPHATNAEVLQSEMEVNRDAVHAWDAWAWAVLQPERQGEGPGGNE